MRIAGALASCGGEVETESFLCDLKEECPGVRTFVFSPPPGMPMAAGIDWALALNSTASVVTLAGALWKVYTKYIAPLREKQKDSQAGIFLMLEEPGNRPVQILIREDFNTQKDFTDKIVQTFSVENKQSTCDDLIELDLWREIE